jgi:hypothetical protein
MKQAVFLLGVLFFFAATAEAQLNIESSLPLASLAPGAALPASSPETPWIFLAATPSSASAFPMPTANPLAGDAQEKNPQPVYSVFPSYNWQATVGYTFFRFYVVPRPSTILNMNGLDLGIVYYPGGRRFGAEGDLMAVWGDSPYGLTSKFGLATGGARVRWLAPGGLQVWAHGLVGGAHFLPQTVYGGQSTLAYQLGGGIDMVRRGGRFAYRAQADMVGTRFFSTYQYSPRISLGIVFRY